MTLKRAWNEDLRSWNCRISHGRDPPESSGQMNPTCFSRCARSGWLILRMRLIFFLSWIFLLHLGLQRLFLSFCHHIWDLWSLIKVEIKLQPLPQWRNQQQISLLFQTHGFHQMCFIDTQNHQSINLGCYRPFNSKQEERDDCLFAYLTSRIPIPLPRDRFKMDLVLKLIRPLVQMGSYSNAAIKKSY